MDESTREFINDALWKLNGGNAPDEDLVAFVYRCSDFTDVLVEDGMGRFKSRQAIAVAVATWERLTGTRCGV